MWAWTQWLRERAGPALKVSSLFAVSWDTDLEVFKVTEQGEKKSQTKTLLKGIGRNIQVVNSRKARESQLLVALGCYLTTFLAIWVVGACALCIPKDFPIVTHVEGGNRWLARGSEVELKIAPNKLLLGSGLATPQPCHSPSHSKHLISIKQGSMQSAFPPPPRNFHSHW